MRTWQCRTGFLAERSLTAPPRRHAPSTPSTLAWTTSVLFALAIVLAAATPARAQTAQIAGQVTDASNAAVPGAVVTITNLATGVLRTGVANSEGLYTVPLLPPGQYRVDVQMDGFAPITRDGVTLVGEQTARIDFVLKVGDHSEQVTVAADALLETDRAGVGTTVTERSIRELPLNVRDPIGLVTSGASATAVDGTSAATSSRPTFASAAAGTAARTCCWTACPTRPAIVHSSRTFRRSTPRRSSRST